MLKTSWLHTKRNALHRALLALGGKSSPECTVLRWAISRAFLCGVCMSSPCSIRTPKEKHAKRTEHVSIPDQRWTGHLTWSPGAEKLPTAPGRSWRRDDPGWVKGRSKIHGDLRPACVCVCVCSEM